MKSFVLVAFCLVVCSFARGADEPKPATGPHNPNGTAPQGAHAQISPTEEKLVKMEKWLHARIKAEVCQRKYGGGGLVEKIEKLTQEPTFLEHKIAPTPFLQALDAMEKVLKMETPKGAGVIDRVQNICLALPQPDADEWFKKIYGDVPKMKLLERVSAAERIFDPYEKDARDRYRAKLNLADRFRYLRRFLADVYGVKLDTDAEFAAKYKEVTGINPPAVDLTAKLSPELDKEVREGLSAAEEEVEKEFKKRLHQQRNPITGILPSDIIKRVDRVHSIFEEYAK